MIGEITDFKELTEWLEKQRELVNNKWTNELSKDVPFKDFFNYKTGEKIEIAKGIIIEIIEIDEKSCILKCWMDGVLFRHYHSTHKELFICIDGEMTDDLNDTIILKKGDTHIYKENIEHQPRGKCSLLIIQYF